MATIEDFLTPDDEAEVIQAIRTAEQSTSGEIRVHLERHCTIDAFDRAAELFDELHMSNTKESNGVLLYIAIEDRTLVIMGDSGINDVVPVDFWESTKDIIIEEFKKGRTKEGLVAGILQAGEQLKKHFPYIKGDQNELPDDISVG